MAKKTALIIAFVIITGALLVSGRFFVSPSPSPSTDPRGAAVGTISQENDNDLAPDFVLEQLSGGTITLSEYRGKKPVVLDFFATWCPNCRRDMPKLNQMYEKYKDKIEVIGVNLQENKGTVERYISGAGITFPIVLDPSKQVSRNYGVRYTNTHVLIDRDGTIIQTISGDIRESAIRSLLQ